MHYILPSIINVWTKYGDHKLYSNGKLILIRKPLIASRPRKQGHGHVIVDHKNDEQGQVTNVWQTCTLHDQCVD